MAISDSIVSIVIISFALISVIASILLTVFWVLMIIDCVRRKFKEETEKIVWILVIIFAGPIGALIYYFIVKKAKKKRK